MIDYNKIKYVVLDVDGTLTDGGIIYDSLGNELKRFDAKDGLGIKVAIAAGLIIVIISGRESLMVKRRASELGVQYLLSGVQLKLPKLLEWMNEHNAVFEEICYIGDDLNDLQCMQSVGLCMCPADASLEITKISHYISHKKGGHGAVRDCIETILREQKKWGTTCEQLYCC